MTLFESIVSIYAQEQFDEERAWDTVYARRPWSIDSEALVTKEPDDGSLPQMASNLGMAYFLEVTIVKEVLEDFTADLPLMKDKCERVIRYAMTDA